MHPHRELAETLVKTGRDNGHFSLAGTIRDRSCVGGSANRAAGGGTRAQGNGCRLWNRVSSIAVGSVRLAERIVFQVSDAQAGAQTDCTFDAIVSRHASWLFPEPAAAYREWTRLLRPGGILLNMDANWLLPLWKTDISAQFWEDEAELICRYGEFQDCYHDKDLMQAFQQLPLAFQSRPAWDEHICRELGLLRVEGRLLKPEIYWNPFLAIRYRTVPTFVICAQKSIK